MAASDYRVRSLQKPLASKGASTDGKRTFPILVEIAKSAIKRTMEVKQRYRKHTAVGPKLIGAFRVAFCVSAAVLCLARAIQGIRTGEVEAPLRAANLVVTTASPAWFVVVLLAYCLMTVMFAFCSYVFAARLVDDFRM